MMTVNELRQKFLDFFESKAHRIIPSDSLIPATDPTLLFTGSGMNQFKEYFLGHNKDLRRAASCQKCLRTDDLDRVGKTPGHHTFFEMLGNFSFGDYFKEEAISWAWEFVTGELNLPKGRIWVSVYKEDDEAYTIWQKKVGVPKERIVRLGPKENFWPANAPLMGPNGPCGPCSEIFYDWGESFGCRKSNCNVDCNCGRFVEVWNLVFTQYDRKEVDVLEPLPSKNIDTGMGLERMAAVLQGKRSNFEIDIFSPIVEAVKDILETRNTEIYAIADHIRAVVFAISDGVLPSNEGRGYVVRKLIRRTFLRAETIGNKEPFIYKITPIVASTMKEPYPELKARRENIASVVLAEEERFRDTLESGTQILTETIGKLKKEKKKEIPGEVVFSLYDTYGFPLDLIESISARCGLAIEKEKYRIAMEEQRQRSKSKSQIAEGIFVGAEGIPTGHFVSGVVREVSPTVFKGYEKDEIETKVLLILKGEVKVKEAGEGERVGLILDKTPFYGEAGGQIGDKGKIKNDNVELDVVDARMVEKRTVHIAEVVRGKIKVGDKVIALIDKDYRAAVARSHTATHLLQAALRKVLGPHVGQSGSWVGADRFRFDFTHFRAVDERELSRIEELVNENVMHDDKVDIQYMGLNQAKKEGALAIFGEKYEDRVRVVSIADYSKELCGGTHLDSTGKIRIFYITQEGSVASGIRRIEAVTGIAAYKKTKEDRQVIRDTLKLLNISQRKKVIPALERIYSNLKDLEKKVKRLDLEKAKLLLDNIISQAKEIDGVKIVGSKIEKADFALLRHLADLTIERAKPCVVGLVSVLGEKVVLVTALSSDLVSRQLDARRIISALAEIIGGKGGGRVDFALGGGKDPSRIGELLEELPKIVERDLKK